MRGARVSGTARGRQGGSRARLDSRRGAPVLFALTCYLTATCLLATVAGVEAQQQPGRAAPPILTESLVGSDLYSTYCSSCHGRSGRGDGPEAQTLKVKPSDLTTLARRNNGVYPAEMVRQRLNGTPGPNGSMAHGSTEMPVWGAIFRELDAKPSVAKVRVDNLVSYLQSIQAK